MRSCAELTRRAANCCVAQGQGGRALRRSRRATPSWLTSYPKSLFAALAILAVALAVVPAGAGARGHVVTWTVSSRYVNFAAEPHIPPPPGVSNALHVDVYLPPGYDGHRRFPVLWLFHGHGCRYSCWVDPGGEDLMRIAGSFPGIIVMPEAGNGWCTNWWHGGRERPAWERFHLDELLPLTERRLRILPGRSNHAIAGLSMGGGCTAYYASQRPGYFGAAAPFSAPLHIERPEWPAGMSTQGEASSDVFGDPTAQAFYWQGHDPQALVANLRYTRMFVAVGDGVPTKPGDLDGGGFRAVAELELHQQALDFVPVARAAGVDVTTDYYHGVHQEAYWQKDLLDAIRWGLFRHVVERPGDWTFSTVSQHSRPWGLRLDFRSPPQAFETFRLRGRVLSASGTGTVTVHADLPRARAFTAVLPFTRVLRPPPARHRRSADDGTRR